MSSIAKTIASMLGLNLGNISEYPIIGNKYYVILGTFITSFSKVSGIILKSSQLRAYNEGGSNKPYIMRDLKTDFNIITFEKGYGTLDVMDMIDKVTVLTILIKGNNGNISGVYYTDRAIVQKVELSDLNANNSESIIQTMTVAYNNLKRSDKIMTALKAFQLVTPSSSDSSSPKDALKRIKEHNAKIKKEVAPSAEKKTDEQIKMETEIRLREEKKKAQERRNLENNPLNPAIDAALRQNMSATLLNKNNAAIKREEEKQKEIMTKIEF